MKIAFEWPTMSTMKQLLWILITDSPKFHEPLGRMSRHFFWSRKGLCIPNGCLLLGLRAHRAQLNLAYFDSFKDVSLDDFRLPLFFGSWKWYILMSTIAGPTNTMYTLKKHAYNNRTPFFEGGRVLSLFSQQWTTWICQTTAMKRPKFHPHPPGMKPPAAQLLSQPSFREGSSKWLEDVWKKNKPIHPRKLTWNLKMMVFHRNLLF